MFGGITEINACMNMKTHFKEFIVLIWILRMIYISIKLINKYNNYAKINLILKGLNLCSIIILIGFCAESVFYTQDSYLVLCGLLMMQFMSWEADIFNKNEI
ncbi:hypothetical protein [Clostridium botulinum]|uniref:hypothetical protein n=1 Tax=Clostridium botulinum TaxID=1491 RepID=UPI0006A40EC5|nr:hypothetical protein [Clostridium botulinum]KOC32403.1 hypothetical protein ADU81_11685 [Clostridium botulinum]